MGCYPRLRGGMVDSLYTRRVVCSSRAVLLAAVGTESDIGALFSPFNAQLTSTWVEVMGTGRR